MSNTNYVVGSQKQKQTKKMLVAPFQCSELVMAGQYLVVVGGQAHIEGVSY